ncbi:MAG: transporter [Planctomycetota bacterium]
MHAIARATAVTLMTAALATAQDVPAELDKSRFSLLNPTPRDLWRPLSSDRPGFTENPYTVDAGAVQVELGFFDFVRNGDSETWTIAPTNLRLGVLNNMDLQFKFTPYSITDDGSRRREGVGDVELRLKLNIWGNDGSDAAVAFLPFMTFPTAADGLGVESVQGGFSLPFATALTERIELGLMAQMDFVYNDVRSRYDTEFTGSGVFSFDVTDALGVYVEGVGIWSTDDGKDVQGIFSTGATYGLTENLVLDVGLNVGLAGDADDLKIVTGLTVRF